MWPLKKKTKEQVENDKLKKYSFEIRYLPITGRYYPMVNGSYLYRRYGSGVLELSLDMPYSEYARTKIEAQVILKAYLEQQNIDLCEIITVSIDDLKNLNNGGER